MKSRECCRSWTVLHTQCAIALSSGFPISQSNAETLDRWGGKAKRLLISCFLSNTSAKNYCNRIVFVKIIANQRWDVFWDTVYINRRLYTESGECSDAITRSFISIKRPMETDSVYLFKSYWDHSRSTVESTIHRTSVGIYNRIKYVSVYEAFSTL